MFGADKLSASIAKEKWDLVRLVATQPFNKHVRYGVAFLTVSGRSASGVVPAKAAAPTLGAFRLKEEKEEIKVGSYFSRMKEGGPSGSSYSPAAALRSETTLAELEVKRARREEEKRKLISPVKEAVVKRRKMVDHSDTLPRRDSLPGESQGNQEDEELKESRRSMFKTFEPKPDKDNKSRDKERKLSKVSDVRKEEKEKEKNLTERVKMFKDKNEGKKAENSVPSHNKENSSERKPSKISDVRKEEKEKEKNLTERVKMFKDKKEGKRTDDFVPNIKDENGSTPKQDQTKFIPTELVIKKPDPKKHAVKYEPFRNLFKGVVFALSGFQNPLRGELRAKALDMGARYEADWSTKCTHLVCAFTNTPKFQQVKAAGGKIVKREWVEESHGGRKGLPWRRFCLDRGDKGEESEGEVWEEGTEEMVEEIASTTTGASAAIAGGTKDSYEVDTDEEIEQIRQRDAKKVAITNSYDMDTDEENEEVKRESEVQDIQNKANSKTSGESYEVETDDEIEPEPSKKSASKDDEGEGDSAYDADTDIDEEELEKLRPKTNHLDFDPLPSHFESLQFYLHGDFEPGEAEVVDRYIVAAGGRVVPYMRESVTRVISASSWWTDQFKEALEVSPGVRFLRPSWVFACCDEGRVVEEGTHRIAK